MSAFFKPPREILDSIGHAEVSLIALPIIIDLAAEVRARRVLLDSCVFSPNFKAVFDDAVSALIVEQDAYWRRSRFTSKPILQARFLNRPASQRPLASDRVVLGFSGGKDSIVSLFALMNAGYEVVPVLVNEGDRTWQDLRKWIPKLKKLGLRPMTCYLLAGRRGPLKKRFGDWYFSSYQIGWLVAVLMLCAVHVSAATVCLGIEASADMSFTAYQGKQINHQHQKTTAHLRKLEDFYRQVLNMKLRIGSPIANATDSEVLIALLNQIPPTFREFSSCGGSNSRSKHCGDCVKCAFVYVLLCACPGGQEIANRIFRNDPLEEPEIYQPWLNTKQSLPPGCVGPRHEVWIALERLVEAGSISATVQKWKRSSLRRRILSGELEFNHQTHVIETSPLLKPVEPAGEIVRSWVRSSRTS